MSSLKLIAVYAGYGDTLLLQTPDTLPQYWLIDGGPVSPFPSRSDPRDYQRFAYYQFLKRALRRFCMNNQGIIKLSGIIVTHPHKDHVAGLIQLIKDWLPDPGSTPSQARPLDFQGPVIMNATCLKRAPSTPKPLYEEKPYQLELAQVLAERHFKPSLITQNTSFFPASMINVSLVDCYAMTQSTAGSYDLPPPPWKVDHARKLKGLDPSSINQRSILTMWTEPPGQRLRLVTTGDAMAFDILPMMEQVEKGPTLGIFKVPHHGSQLNSQSEENSVSKTTINVEKDHVFLLAMLVEEYILQNPNPNSNDPRLQAIHNDNLGEPQDEWNAMIAAKNIAKPFQDLLARASEAICQYLGGHKFKVIQSVTIDLSTPDGRRQFALELAAREDKKKSLILNSADGKVTEEPSLIELMQSESVTVGPAKKVTKFMLQTVFNLYKRDDWLELLPVLRDALFANEINSLHMAKFIANFYKSFTATNYIISANGEHGHPNASTIAGIMAACLMKQKPLLPARLFVTSGYSVQLDYVRNIVRLLVSTATPPPTPPEWAGWIQLYCLNNDYLMPIPLDNSPVSESTEILFPSIGMPQEAELTMLHNQFKLAKPYDMPRAAVSACSTFHLILKGSNKGPEVGYLSINANNDLELVTTRQPLFMIEHMGYGPTSNQPNPPLPKFKLRLYNSNSSLSTEIMFSTTNFSTPPTSRISTVGPPRMELCYDPTHNPVLWFDANAATPAYVVTKRVDELP